MKLPRNAEDVAELFRVEGEDPEPRGSRASSSEVYRGGYETHEAPEDEMEEYWRLYENFPVVRMSISGFAEEVVEPGWYVVAEDEETAEELTEWLMESATVAGEEEQDFLEILRQATVQREVRGTSLIEKVRGKNSGNVVALQSLNPETFKCYTRPRSNVLIRPDDIDLSEDDLQKVLKKRDNRTRLHGDDVPVTEDGDAAAYVQWDSGVHRWNDKSEVYFTRDDIIKITRDDDIGEVFGTSRVEAVADRVHGIQQKLVDNDEAINQKAWPFWMFKAGPESGEETWEEEDLDEFMKNFELDEFAPGSKVVVPGSMSLETFAGETADIYQSLEYDINHIALGLPMPQHSLGAFGEEVNQARAQAQNQRLRRQVSDVRGELESKFTPLLKEVAEERDLNEPDSVALKLGRPDEPAPEMMDQTQVRYMSDSPQGGGPDPNNQPGPQAGPEFSGGPNDTNRQQDDSGVGGQVRANNPMDGAPATSVSTGMYTASPGIGGPQVNGGSSSDMPVVQLEADDPDSVWDYTPDEEVEELADPRYVSVRDETRSLTNTISNYMGEVRSSILEEMSDARNKRSALTRIDRVSKGAINDAKPTYKLDQAASEAAESVVRSSIDSMGQQYHSPTISTHYGVRASESADMYSSNIQDSIERATSEMTSRIKRIIVTGVQNGDDWDRIEDRVENRFDRKKIRTRARVIAHMELKSAVESTKLAEYEAADEVVGVEVLNPCTPSTTRLCRNLGGCDGDNATAYFGPDKSIASQLQSQVRQDQLLSGFTPLPAAPPYHYGCRSTIVPIKADEDELKDGSLMFDVTDTVMSPEGPGLIVQVMEEDFELVREGQPQQVEARPNYRAYVVQLIEKDGKEVYREEDLEQAEAIFETTKQKRKKEREDVADEEIDDEIEERRKEEEKSQKEDE